MTKKKVVRIFFRELKGTFKDFFPKIYFQKIFAPPIFVTQIFAPPIFMTSLRPCLRTVWILGNSFYERLLFTNTDRLSIAQWFPNYEPLTIHSFWRNFKDVWGEPVYRDLQIAS